MDELWFAAPKLRDDTLDIDVFCRHATASVASCNTCRLERNEASNLAVSIS